MTDEFAPDAEVPARSWCDLCERLTTHDVAGFCVFCEFDVVLQGDDDD